MTRTRKHQAALHAGIGLAWRPETAWRIARGQGVTFSEEIAERVDPRRLPGALAAAIERGLPVIAHGVGLDLGGTRLDRDRVRRFAQVARALRSPLASEHVAFCRAGELESPHFLPVPHDRAQLAVLVDHVRQLQDKLDVPLALENVAAPLVWPGSDLSEAEFIGELVDRTGALLLLDVANLHANLVNHGGDLERYLAQLPLDRVAYLHAAGGARSPTGMWRDTHAHPIAPSLLDTLGTVLARTGPVPILLERDHGFGTPRELDAELAALAGVLAAAPAKAPVPVARRQLACSGDLGRDELSARQHTLLAALLAGEVVPPGFDPRHIGETRSILDDKRARCARR